tara:strand:- start:136 stop:528 length:393 start_codon:yes stop_codon:yes gene_type:complete
VGTSPRSRWSNRDELSYREKRTQKKSVIRTQLSKWVKPSADSSGSILIVGQLTSLVTLVMLYAGKSSGTESLEQTSAWVLGESALLVTGVFGITSFLCLFRVSISRKAPKRRKRMARLWLLASLLATQLT